MTMNKTIVALLVAISFAAHAADRQEPTIENFLAVSGIKASLDKMPAQIGSQLFGNMPASVPETTKREVARGYTEAFPDGSITAAVTRTLNSEASKIPHLISIATTPTSMKMTALELKEPKEKEFRDFAATIQLKPPAKERVVLLKEILDESHAVDMLSTIAFATSESIAIATSSGCADDVKRIRTELAARQSAIREGVLSSAMFSMIFTYRTATDGELREYLASYRDPDTRVLHAQLAKLAAKEYLSRWKLFEKTLYRVGADLSGRSMFAKSCRKTGFAEPAAARAQVVDTVMPTPMRSSLSGKDVRECLALTDNVNISSCAQKYQ